MNHKEKMAAASKGKELPVQVNKLDDFDERGPQEKQSTNVRASDRSDAMPRKQLQRPVK